MKKILIVFLYFCAGVSMIYFTGKYFGIDYGDNLITLLSAFFLVSYGFLLSYSLLKIRGSIGVLMVIPISYIIAFLCGYFEIDISYFDRLIYLIYFTGSLIFGVSIYFYYNYLNFKI